MALLEVNGLTKRLGAPLGADGSMQRAAMHAGGRGVIKQPAERQARRPRSGRRGRAQRSSTPQFTTSARRSPARRVRSLTNKTACTRRDGR